MVKSCKIMCMLLGMLKAPYNLFTKNTQMENYFSQFVNLCQLLVLSISAVKLPKSAFIFKFDNHNLRSVWKLKKKSTGHLNGIHLNTIPPNDGIIPWPSIQTKNVKFWNLFLDWSYLQQWTVWKSCLYFGHWLQGRNVLCSGIILCLS